MLEMRHSRLVLTGASHGNPESEYQPVTPAHDRGHADAEIWREDAVPVCSRSPAICQIPWSIPETASVEELRNYQLHLVDHGTSPASLNAAICELKFFFGVTLDRPEAMAKMKPVHLPRKLPDILSPDEVG